MVKSESKIPSKNYFIVILISLFTLVITCYLAFWYQNNQEYYKNNSVMSGYLSEIGEEAIIENISNYVIDNPDCILYISFGNDQSIKNFENEFKNFINKYEIESEFIYADLNLISNKNFMTELQEQFFSDVLKNSNMELNKQSNLFIFENGKVVDILYFSKKTIKLDDVKAFLVEHEVINND